MWSHGTEDLESEYPRYTERIDNELFNIMNEFVDSAPEGSGVEIPQRCLVSAHFCDCVTASAQTAGASREHKYPC